MAVFTSVDKSISIKTLKEIAGVHFVEKLCITSGHEAFVTGDPAVVQRCPGEQFFSLW
jgi:hypothetical protein